MLNALLLWVLDVHVGVCQDISKMSTALDIHGPQAGRVQIHRALNGSAHILYCVYIYDRYPSHMEAPLKGPGFLCNNSTSCFKLLATYNMCHPFHFLFYPPLLISFSKVQVQHQRTTSGETAPAPNSTWRETFSVPVFLVWRQQTTRRVDWFWKKICYIKTFWICRKNAISISIFDKCIKMYVYYEASSAQVACV